MWPRQGCVPNTLHREEAAEEETWAPSQESVASSRLYLDFFAWVICVYSLEDPVRVVHNKVCNKRCVSVSYLRQTVIHLWNKWAIDFVIFSYTLSSVFSLNVCPSLFTHFLWLSSFFIDETFFMFFLTSSEASHDLGVFLSWKRHLTCHLSSNRTVINRRWASSPKSLLNRVTRNFFKNQLIQEFHLTIKYLKLRMLLSSPTGSFWLITESPESLGRDLQS